MGAVLGALLFVGLGIIFYLFRSHSRVIPVAPANAIRDDTAVEKADDGDIGMQALTSYGEFEVGGRLRYPNEHTDEGGRLGTTV